MLKLTATIIIVLFNKPFLTEAYSLKVKLTATIIISLLIKPFLAEA